MSEKPSSPPCLASPFRESRARSFGAYRRPELTRTAVDSGYAAGIFAPRTWDEGAPQPWVAKLLLEAELTFAHSVNRSPHGRDYARVDPDRDCAFRLCCRSRTAEVRTPSLSLCSLTWAALSLQETDVARKWCAEPTFSGIGRVSPCCSDLCTSILPGEGLATSQPQTRTDPCMNSDHDLCFPRSECSSGG